jgi:hypothetical protein
VLKRNLSKELLDKPDASKQEITEALSLFKNPVIIHSVLSTAMWEPDGSKVVSWYLDFWNDSWDMSSGPHLFICLHIEFDRKREEYLPNEEKVRNFVTDLDLTQYDKLHVTYLSELNPVAYLDAKTWVGNENNFEGFCKVHGPKFCDEDAVVRELYELYKQPDKVDSEGRISMLKLAPRLKQLIKDNYCQRNSV